MQPKHSDDDCNSSSTVGASISLAKTTKPHSGSGPIDQSLHVKATGFNIEPLHRYSRAPNGSVDPSFSVGRPIFCRTSSPLVTRFSMSVGTSANSRARSNNTGDDGVDAPSQSDQKWTVFNQLMENSRQLSSSPQQYSVYHENSEVWESGTQDDSSKCGDSDAFFPHDEPLENNRKLNSESLASTPRASFRTLGRDTEPEPDDDDCTSSDTEVHDPFFSPSSQVRWFSKPSTLTLPLLYRNILKCSIAYFIASLFTFAPPFSRLIGNIVGKGSGTHIPSPSGHLVASIAVYFNPAKTIGGMIEADVFCLAGLLYTSFVCLALMKVLWWLESSDGWEWLADFAVVVLIGVNMSCIAWTKVWMANPSFNTACSMMSIILFVVIVKEGGPDMLFKVASIVMYGSAISNVICYTVWPQSAIFSLQLNMSKTLDSFSTVLKMLTQTFLLETGVHSRNHLSKIQKAVENHQSSFTSLKKSFSEARTEWIRRGFGEEITSSWAECAGKSAYEDTVDCLNRLGQHLNGLRSGTQLQYDLTKAGIASGRNSKGKNSLPLEFEIDHILDEESAMLKAAASMFGELVDEMGPPLRALSSTCSTSLRRLRIAFEHSKSEKKKVDAFRPDEFIALVDSIEKALLRFESTSNHAVMRLYRKSDFATSPSSRAESLTSVNSGKYEVPLWNENEQVFLVYFFIFTLQEFARQMVSLIDAMRRIYEYEEDLMRRDPWWKRLSKNCMSWCGSSPREVRTSHPALRRTFSAYLKSSNHNRFPSFPKVRPHAPNTMLTPPRNKLSVIGKLQQSLWALGNWMGERNAKYAVKAGLAIALLAAPAFIEKTRPIFVENWGEWALISCFVVLSPTIGATNYLSLQRILGTIFGAAVAAGIYSLFSENPIVLSIFGFLFSVPCFYLGLGYPQYLIASRFILLTYNLTCLYSYNVRRNDIPVVHIALHRALSVTVGVLWAAFVSRFWWPSEARRELSKGLGEICLNMGWLYTRLVASYSFSPDYGMDNAVNEASTDETHLLAVPQQSRLRNSTHEFMAMELHLQIKLIELQGLLAEAQHEPRLKGPFPVLLYRSILTSLQTILDKLHSMRCVTTREEWYTNIRREFIIPVNRERREMVGNVILSFSILSCAFRLKAPLPPYLPPAEESRRRLVDAIRNLEVVKKRDVRVSRQLLFFAYALTMKRVTEELEALGRTLQNAFGVIGQTPEEFEALFMEP